MNRAQARGDLALISILNVILSAKKRGRVQGPASRNTTPSLSLRCPEFRKPSAQGLTLCPDQMMSFFLYYRSSSPNARRERDASACIRRHQALALAPVPANGAHMVSIATISLAASDPIQTVISLQKTVGNGASCYHDADAVGRLHGPGGGGVGHHMFERHFHCAPRHRAWQKLLKMSFNTLRTNLRFLRQMPPCDEKYICFVRQTCK